jgi:hypothetical protein
MDNMENMSTNADNKSEKEGIKIDPELEKENELNLEDEKEALIEAGENRREKIEISEEMTPEEIQEKFNVSRTTAWRAKERGWLFLNYLQRAVDVDNDWADSHIQEIKDSARIGAHLAMRRLHKAFYKELRPFSFEDLISCAYVRLMELSGHPQRDVQIWRNAVAKNAASDFIKTQIIAAGKVFVEKDELDIAKKEE